MVANKQAARPAAPAWKPIVVIGGIVVAVFVLIFGGLYLANRPNYRDLEKEFKRISANIPADWRLVNRNVDKGTLGLFCFGIDDSACPYIVFEYSYDSLQVTEPNILVSSLQKIVRNSGFTLSNDTFQKCDVESISKNQFTCSAYGYTGNIELYVDISSANSQGKAGNWASIRLSKYEE